MPTRPYNYNTFFPSPNVAGSDAAMNHLSEAEAFLNDAKDEIDDFKSSRTQAETTEEFWRDHVQFSQLLRQRRHWEGVLDSMEPSVAVLDYAYPEIRAPHRRTLMPREETMDNIDPIDLLQEDPGTFLFLIPSRRQQR